MRIHYKEPSAITRFKETFGLENLEEMEREFDGIFQRIRKYKDITPESRMLEIGTGSGWIPIICCKKGLRCKGIDISPQLIDFAMETGAKFGIKPDIELGNIEETDIGESEYDVIIANCTFEHVEHWREGIRNVYRALKPEGLFFFYSTNKFAVRSGEYKLPFYSWLPDRARYRLRMAIQGADIMHLGIDFNEFTYYQLRGFFRKSGFTRVLDRVDIIDEEKIRSLKPPLGSAVRLVKKIGILKDLVLLFYPETFFICIK